MEVKIAFQNVTSYDYTVLFSFSDLASPESRVFVGSALKIATRVEVASPAMQILTVAREKPIVLTVEPLAASRCGACQAAREKSTSHGVDVTCGHSAATLGGDSRVAALAVARLQRSSRAVIIGEPWQL